MSKEFPIQCWEGAHLLSRFDLGDPAQRQAILDRFDGCTLPDWALVAHVIPDPIRWLIEESEFGCAIQLRSLWKIDAALRAIPGALVTVPAGTHKTPTAVPDLSMPGVADMVAGAIEANIAAIRTACPEVLHFAMDSELPFSQPDTPWPPEEGEPFVALKTWEETAPYLRRIRDEANRAILYDAVQRIHGEQLLGDSQQCGPWQSEGRDGMIQWALVNTAPYTPPWTWYWVERWRADCAMTGRPNLPILCGPQMGLATQLQMGQTVPDATMDITANRTVAWIGASPDVYEAACWSSIAAGANGLTGWGISAMLRAPGEWNRNGEVLWARQARIKADVDRLTPIISQWRPAPRKTAVLWSMTDLAWESGRGAQPTKSPNVHPTVSRTYAQTYALPNALFALLMHGEPADIVTDEEVLHIGELPGRIYDRIIVPCGYVLDVECHEHLKTLAARGVDVVTHAGGALDRNRFPGLRVVEVALHGEQNPQSWTPYYDDFAAMGYITYQDFLRRLGRELLAAGPPPQHAWADAAGLWVNEMVGADSSRYLVAVNRRFRCGPDDAWRAALRPIFAGKVADQGIAVDCENESGYTLKDMLSGVIADPQATMQFPAGSGKVLRIVT